MGYGEGVGIISSMPFEYCHILVVLFWCYFLPSLSLSPPRTWTPFTGMEWKSHFIQKEVKLCQQQKYHSV